MQAMIHPYITILKRLLDQKLKEEDLYLWEKHARETQRVPEGKWRTWLILAGRGFGKTRTGAETIRQWVKAKVSKRIALVGETERDVRDVMVEGTSGILSVHPPHERPIFEPANRKLIWPSGAVAHIFSSEAYEKLRGPQFDAAWVDELAKFSNAEETWDQLMFGLRLGAHPRVIVTTTPRPLPLIHTLLKDPSTVVTRGSTYENSSNLSPLFLEHMREKYEKTRMGAQELYAEILSEHQDALWRRSLIHYRSVNRSDLCRVVIGVDPATTANEESDETGIIVTGRDAEGRAYILDDLSGVYRPHVWSHKILEAYEHYQADRVVAEVNAGGDMIAHILRSLDPHISFKPVRAVRGKTLRAEPIAALYEQKKVWHVRPFHLLEDQMCSFTPAHITNSPDRVDALVWGLTELILNATPFPMAWREN